MTLQAATGASKKHIYRPPISWDKTKKSMSSLLLLPALDTRWKCVPIFAHVFGQNFSLARFCSVKTLLAWMGRRTHNLYMCARLGQHTYNLYICACKCKHTQPLYVFTCVLASADTQNLYMCACFGKRTQPLCVFLLGYAQTNLYMCACLGGYTQPLSMCACLGKPTQPLYVCVLR